MDGSIGVQGRSVPRGSAGDWDLAMRVDGLTAGELRVLQMLTRGATNREIAASACISENTVKFHLKNVYGKLGVSSRAAAVFSAMQQGLVAGT